MKTVYTPRDDPSKGAREHADANRGSMEAVLCRQQCSSGKLTWCPCREGRGTAEPPPPPAGYATQRDAGRRGVTVAPHPLRPTPHGQSGRQQGATTPPEAPHGGEGEQPPPAESEPAGPP